MLYRTGNRNPPSPGCRERQRKSKDIMKGSSSKKKKNCTIPPEEATTTPSSSSKREEEEEEEEDKFAASEDEGDKDTEADEEGGHFGERPKLDDGYYEIEDVRKKRVRKGQIQYLIKWRGWPETANTWEPLENVQNCADVIEAFEESLRGGKHKSSQSTRKRKRKNGGLLSQGKKKRGAGNYLGSSSSDKGGSEKESPLPPNQQELPATTEKQHSVADALDLHSSHKQSTHLVNGTAGEEEKVGKINGKDEHEELDGDPVVGNGNGNGNGNASREYVYSDPDHQEKQEQVPSSGEPKNANGVVEESIANISIRFPDGMPLLESSCQDAITKLECSKPIQSDRCTGAKKRKSGSVRRFKQDPISCGSNKAQNKGTSSGMEDAGAIEEEEGADNSKEKESQELDLSCRRISSTSRDNSANPSYMTKIIKAISYNTSTSNNVHDVLVTFKALRSDGEEVVVDNTFLKVNNPLLLISFYEQHLRYSPT